MADARRDQIVAEARILLEAEGEAGLSMRRLAERLGIQAPSLYKHVPGKRDLQAAIVADGLRELGAALAAAPPGIAGLAAAYRAFALAHPHLYELMTERPLARDLLPPGLEDEVAAPLVAALGDEHRARAAWASAHGMASLELAGRFPEGADVDAAWVAMARAFGAG